MVKTHECEGSKAVHQKAKIRNNGRPTTNGTQAVPRSNGPRGKEKCWGNMHVYKTNKTQKDQNHDGKENGKARNGSDEGTIRRAVGGKQGERGEESTELLGTGRRSNRQKKRPVIVQSRKHGKKETTISSWARESRNIKRKN